MKRCILVFAIVYVYFAQAFAAPATPARRQIIQPDGTKIRVFIKGDEFQHWIQTEKGYTVLENKKNGRWEYALRSKTGDLTPSGIKVDLARVPPAFIRQGVIPKRRMLTGITKTPISVGGKSILKSNNWPAQQVPSSRNLLFILVSFSNRALQTNAADWGKAAFDTVPSVRSVAAYFKDNSYGKFSFIPVTHTQQGSQSGVLTVSIPQKREILDSTFLSDQIAWINATLAAASQFVDFKSFDANQDGVFDNDEINVYFVLAGYEESDTTKTPSAWSRHVSVSPANLLYGHITAGGVQLREWSQGGELNDADKQLAIGALVHECGHSLGLPDLYDASIWKDPNHANEGIGIFSAMGTGNYGSDLPAEWKNGEFDTSMHSTVPVGLDAWSREYLRWNTPRVASSSNILDFPPALEAIDSVVKINPCINEDQYFLVENRYPKSWDTGFVYWYGTNWNGGLLILHVDNRIGTPKDNDINYNDPISHQGVMPEIACAPGNYYLGEQCALFYQGNNDKFDGTTTPNSNFYKEVATNQQALSTSIAVHDVSLPQATMKASVFFPTPYSLTVSHSLKGNMLTVTAEITDAGNPVTGAILVPYLRAIGAATWHEGKAMHTDANGICRTTFAITNPARDHKPFDFKKAGYEVKLVSRVQRPNHTCTDTLVYKCADVLTCTRE